MVSAVPITGQVPAVAANRLDAAISGSSMRPPRYSARSARVGAGARRASR